MKIIDTSVFFLFLGLASYGSALDQPKSHLRASETSDSRELFIFGQRGCKRSLAVCQAITGAAQLPYGQWIQTLDQIDGQQDFVDDIKYVIESLSTADFSGLSDGIKAESREIASAISELQGAVAQVEEVNTEIDDPAVKFSLITNLLTTVMSIFSQVSGVNLDFLSPLLGLVNQMLSLLDQGPSAMANTVMKALSTFAINMVTQFVQGILTGNRGGGPKEATPAVVEKAPTTAQTCLQDLAECEFAKMVLTVLPALVGGALIIAGTAVQNVETP